jgi:hypothetical protein
MPLTGETCTTRDVIDRLLDDFAGWRRRSDAGRGEAVAGKTPAFPALAASQASLVWLLFHSWSSTPPPARLFHHAVTAIVVTEISIISNYTIQIVPFSAPHNPPGNQALHPRLQPPADVLTLTSSDGFTPEPPRPV